VNPLYQQTFDKELATNRTFLDGQSASGVGREYYNFDYALGAGVAMWETTKDFKYADLALGWAENMVKAARIIDKNGNRNWSGEWASPYTSTLIAWELDESIGATSMARLARVLITEPGIDDVRKNRATQIYVFVRDHITNKILIKRGAWPDMVRRVNQSTAGMGDKPALHLRALLDLMLTSTALGNADNATFDWPAKVNLLANGIRNHNGGLDRFIPFNGGLLWDKGFGLENPYTCMDVSHAGRVPKVIIDLYRAGIVFDLPFIQALCNTLTQTIWNQSITDPMFRNFINGTNTAFRNRGPWAAGLIYDGWNHLAQFDPLILQIMDVTLTLILDGKTNLSLPYNASRFGRLALSARLCEAQALLPPLPDPDPIPDPDPVPLTFTVTLTFTEAEMLEKGWAPAP